MPEKLFGIRDDLTQIWQDWTPWYQFEKVVITGSFGNSNIRRVDSRSNEDLQAAIEREELFQQDALNDLKVGSGHCLATLFIPNPGPDEETIQRIVEKQMTRAKIKKWTLVLHIVSAPKEES